MSSDEEVLNACLDLFRRLPPQNVERNLERVCELVPDLADELLSTIDVPLKVLQDAKGKAFLGCDYNRDGDSFRSPWDNEFYPALSLADDEEPTKPSVKLRKLEQRMNSAFDVYRELYYEGGTSSVYLWDLDDAWAGVVLLKKTIDNDAEHKASWDSIHVFDALEKGRSAHYKLTSTVLLSMETLGQDKVTLAGSITRQHEADAPFDSSNENAHVVNVGKMVEDMENRMRNTLSEVYFSTSDVDFVRSRLEIGLEPTPSLASPAAVQTPRAVPTTPKPLGQAKALWSYQKTQPDDLAFVAGDTIDILEETNADWWRGSCNGQTGLFPSNHVERLPSIETLSIASSSSSLVSTGPHSIPPPPMRHLPPPQQHYQQQQQPQQYGSYNSNEAYYSAGGGPPYSEKQSLVPQPAPGQGPSQSPVQPGQSPQVPPIPPKKPKLGKTGKMMANSFASGAGFGAGAALASEAVHAIF